MVCIVSVLYTEGQPETYCGVQVKTEDEALPHTWASGDFVADYNSAVDFARSNCLVFLHSSTVDNFLTEAGIEVVYADDDLEEN